MLAVWLIAMIMKVEEEEEEETEDEEEKEITRQLTTLTHVGQGIKKKRKILASITAGSMGWVYGLSCATTRYCRPQYYFSSTWWPLRRPPTLTWLTPHRRASKCAECRYKGAGWRVKGEGWMVRQDSHEEFYASYWNEVITHFRSFIYINFCRNGPPTLT